MNTIFLTSFLLFFFLTSPLIASVEPYLSPVKTKAPEPPSRYEQYIRDIDRKFDRGGLNFLVGWTEILRQPVLHYKNQENKNRTLQAVKGFGVGLWNGVADTLGGFGNTLTSLSPGWEIPLPQGGLTSKMITGGDPDSFQSKNEYNVSSPSDRPSDLYAS